MREFLDKLDTIADQNEAIEREERVDVYIRKLRDLISAQREPREVIAQVVNDLADIDFAALPINHRARFKEAIALLKNILAGNPNNTPDPVTPTAKALTRLFDDGLLDRP